MRKSIKAVLVIAIALGLIAGGGAAYAWWSAAGAGTSSATTSGTATNNIMVNTTSAAITSLLPGAAVSPLSGNFTNSGTGSVTISNVVISFTVTQAAGAVGTCTVADYAIVQPVISPAQTITTGAANGSWAGSVAMNNRTSNQNGCLGATLNFSYAIS